MGVYDIERERERERKKERKKERELATSDIFLCDG